MSEEFVFIALQVITKEEKEATPKDSGDSKDSRSNLLDEGGNDPSTIMANSMVD